MALDSFRRVPTSALTAFLCLLTSRVLAHDVTTTPYAGVTHVHTIAGDQDFHLVRIDLRARGVKVVATPPQGAWSIVSEFARKAGAEIAINANFFSKTESCGMTAGGTEVWKAVYNGCPMTLSFFSNGKAVISTTRAKQNPPARFPSSLVAAVSGRPSLIRDGKPVATTERFATIRHPRTAVGLTKNGRELLLLIVDGRRPGAIGMTGPELTEVFLKAGARHAINLDGGGSTTLYIEAEGGVQNKPSDGRERVVINHLGFDVK